MDWDDEFDNGFSGIAHDFHNSSSIRGDKTGGGLDPFDISNPTSAYLLLSDDAQDEITGGDKRRMKCLTCSYRFIGEIYDSCPKCNSVNTEEAISVLEDEEDSSNQTDMRCLDCGHTFMGEIYASCPECFSPDTEEVIDQNDDGYS